MQNTLGWTTGSNDTIFKLIAAGKQMAWRSQVTQYCKLIHRYLVMTYGWRSRRSSLARRVLNTVVRKYYTECDCLVIVGTVAVGVVTIPRPDLDCSWNLKDGSFIVRGQSVKMLHRAQMKHHT